MVGVEYGNSKVGVVKIATCEQRYEHVRCRLQFHYTASFQLPIIHVVFYTPPNYKQLLRVTAMKLNNMVARNKRKKNYAKQCGNNNAYQLR